MKTRLGFVSNSSSSSFVVPFGNELRQIASKQRDFSEVINKIKEKCAEQAALGSFFVFIYLSELVNYDWYQSSTEFLRQADLTSIDNWCQQNRILLTYEDTEGDTHLTFDWGLEYEKWENDDV